MNGTIHELQSKLLKGGVHIGDSIDEYDGAC